MNGLHWIIRTEEQRENLIANIRDFPVTFQCKVSEPSSPKTTQQIRYAHSLCNALAIYKQASPEAAKLDCKRAYGVIVVSQSLVTGDRTARLVSFADYKRKEMEGFLTSMEVFLSENDIPFTPSEEY